MLSPSMIFLLLGVEVSLLVRRQTTEPFPAFSATVALAGVIGDQQHRIGLARMRVGLSFPFVIYRRAAVEGQSETRHFAVRVGTQPRLVR